MRLREPRARRRGCVEDPHLVPRRRGVDAGSAEALRERLVELALGVAHVGDPHPRIHADANPRGLDLRDPDDGSRIVEHPAVRRDDLAGDREGAGEIGRMGDDQGQM